MILYHITSLEKPIQSILIPKIPDETEIGENYTEKRICLAPSILECLKSAEIVNKFDDEVGLVRVYKVKINEDDPNLVGWNKLYEEGLVKAIGVSNFLEHHLEKLSVKANIAPAVDQFECNPYLTRQSLRQYCRKHDIVPEAWSPLGRGACFEDPVLLEIAKRHGKSVAQVILRYDVQNGIITIPKSTKEERIIQNAQVFDFALTEEEIAAMDGLNRDEMHGDPDYVNF